MKRFITALVIGMLCSAVFGDSQSNAIIQKQAQEIKALKAEIAALKQGTKAAVKKAPLSSADQRKVTTLKNKIATVDREIKKCQYKIRNVKYRILKMTDEDRKGWYYRKTGSISRLSPISSLPRNWNRKTVRIVYISKDEKREKLKKEYQKELAKLEKEKEALEKQLAAIS